MCQNYRSCRKHWSCRGISSNGVCLVGFASMYTLIKSINLEKKTFLLALSLTVYTFKNFKVCTVMEAQPPICFNLSLWEECAILQISILFHSRSSFTICLQHILLPIFSENWVLRIEQRTFAVSCNREELHTVQLLNPRLYTSILCSLWKRLMLKYERKI